MTELEAIKDAAGRLLSHMSCECEGNPDGNYKCHEKNLRDKLEELIK